MAKPIEMHIGYALGWAQRSIC